MMPDETEEEYVARRVSRRKGEEKHEREELEKEELRLALESREGKTSLVNYLIDVGKSVLAGGERRVFSKEEYLEAGKGVWEDIINTKWRKMEARRIEEDQVILGESIVLARKNQEMLDAKIAMDPDQEIYIRSTIRGEWLDNPAIRSEKEAVALAMDNFNKDRLEIGKLAEKRWKEKTGWDEPPTPKLPWTYRFADYPRSKEPKDFKRRHGVYGKGSLVKQVAAKRRKATDTTTTTTTGTVYEQHA
jgi:hypothetical protein